jgi:hypothetical protein
MSGRDPRDTPAAADDEPFLGRWSRLKAQAREREAEPAPPVDEQAAAPSPAPPADAAPAAEPPLPVELPDIDQLGEDSDYSAFLAEGVDAELRKRALRKLFHSPKFNVFDGLDTYRDDFTSFPALGSVVTVDMRHQLERAARELAARAEKALARDPPATDATPPAVTHEPPPPPAAEPTARKEEDAEHGPA